VPFIGRALVSAVHKNSAPPHRWNSALEESHYADIRMVDKAKATVLVVEDHDSVRIAIATFLKAGGFNVLEASTPQAARTIWAAQAGRIGLLLVDIALGENSSGPDLVEEMFKEGPAIPVLFATAADDAHSRQATRNFPNPTILQKPFSPEALVKAVRTALAEPQVLSGFTTFFKRPAGTA
jgi:DNA-binding NtrC family response regulator